MAKGHKVNHSQDITNLYHTYQSGNEAALAQLMEKQLSAEEYDCMLSQRNRAWADKIKTFNTDSWPTFIAVGASHLVGAHNFLDMLREQGFAVERITFK